MLFKLTDTKRSKITLHCGKKNFTSTNRYETPKAIRLLFSIKGFEVAEF